MTHFIFIQCENKKFHQSKSLICVCINLITVFILSYSSLHFFKCSYLYKMWKEELWTWMFSRIIWFAGLESTKVWVFNYIRPCLRILVTLYCNLLGIQTHYFRLFSTIFIISTTQFSDCVKMLKINTLSWHMNTKKISTKRRTATKEIWMCPWVLY